MSALKALTLILAFQTSWNYENLVPVNKFEPFKVHAMHNRISFTFANQPHLNCARMVMK